MNATPLNAILLNAILLNATPLYNIKSWQLIIRLEMKNYNINRGAAKVSSESSGKFHKYEYLTGEDILPSNQQQIIEQAKFTYFPLGKAFE